MQLASFAEGEEAVRADFAGLPHRYVADPFGNSIGPMEPVG